MWTSILEQFAEKVVQVLVGLKSPGAEFLDLAPLPSAPEHAAAEHAPPESASDDGG